MAEMPPVIFPFRRLLAVLQAHGFTFGIDSLMRLNRYWLFMQQKEGVTREWVKYQLAALLCRNEEEQVLFNDIFELNYPWLEALDLEQVELEAEEKPSPTPPLPPPVQPERKEPPVRKSSPPPPPIISTKGPILPKLSFPGNPLRAWNLPEMGPALVPLQEKVWMDTQEWDIPTTIRDTIRAGGIPRLAFRRRKRAPRYLALIEQQSPRDHMAGFAAELVQEINRRDLETDFYFFKNSPARVWKDLPNQRSHVYLELLKSEWEGARLLLVGEASCFIDPITGNPSNLTLDILEGWSQVALLCTNSPLEWGNAEQTLNELFPVVPLSTGGLSMLMGLWNGVFAKSPLQWQLEQPESLPPSLNLNGERTQNDLVVELFRFLGKPAFRWVCATTVYPEIYYELTAHLHDEAIPPAADFSEWKQNEVWHEALRTISRLDWYRLGYVPERMREDLRQRLSSNDLAIVETEIRRLLEWSYNAVEEDSYAYAERREIFSWLGARLFRVLWLDDHPENNHVRQDALTKELGIVFRNARTTGEGLDFLQKEAIDFAISDVGRDDEENAAFNTMREIRTLRPSLPVVFFTNTRGMNMRSALLEMGAREVTNDYQVLHDLLGKSVRQKFGLEEPVVVEVPPGGYGEQEAGATLEEETESTETQAEVSDMWRNLAWSVCQITLANGTNGTGFLIEDGYILTAHNVLPDRESARGAKTTFVHPESHALQHFELEPEDFASDKEMDCTRVRLKKYLYDNYRLFGFLTIGTGTLGTGAKVSLIYFDPQLRDVRFSLDRPVVQFSQTTFRYEAETVPGSSGAPVFNEKGQVIGMHLARTDQENVKRGVLMRAVLERLERKARGGGEQFKRLKEMIGEGETGRALEFLLQNFPDNNEVLMLSAQFKRNEKDRLRGTIPDDEYRRQQYQILASLLSLIDELQKTHGDIPFTGQTRVAGRYDQLRQLLAEEEIRQVLEILTKEHPYNADLTLLLANFNQVERSYINGTIDSNQYRQEKNRIMSATLNQMDVLGQESDEYAQTSNVEVPLESERQQYLRQLVIEGKIDEVFKVLLENPSDPEPLVLLQAKFQENERRLNRGIISQDEYRISLNQVNYTLLEIIANLGSAEPAYSQEAPPQEQVQQTQEPASDSRKIFISFAHEDEAYLGRFLKHLAPLRRLEKVEVWSARDVLPGEEWEKVILENLSTSNIMVLLISADYLANDWIWDNELAIALRRYQEGSAEVVPVILRPCDWQSTPLNSLPVLPSEARPVTSWQDENDAWVEVVSAIRQILSGMNNKQEMV